LLAGIFREAVRKYKQKILTVSTEASVFVFGWMGDEHKT